jgi:hypothetical protein
MKLAFPIDWLAKLNYGLQVMAFALAISAIQFAFQPDIAYEISMRYALCISFFAWILIDFGRHFFASAKETQWPLGVMGFGLTLFGNVAGYLLGTLAADWWCGWPGGSFAAENRFQLKVSIMISAIAGAVASYYFYSKSKAGYFEAKITEANRQASESRLKLLETQLEPHMMFNTLANLRVLIAVDSDRAVQMLDHMIAYLRATLGASRSATHSLQAEFDRLNDYLQLMAVRMGPRLQHRFDLPVDLAAYTVPTLLLQPLVENAIKHGLEPKIEGGSVTVAARRNPSGSLVLTVADTGAQTQGQAALNPEGYGLSHVRERLATAYGAQASLSLESPQTGGTLVTLVIPAIAAKPA